METHNGELRSTTYTDDPNYFGMVYIPDMNYDEELYTRLYSHLYGLVLSEYRKRKDIIRFKFENNTIVTMKIRSALINLVFWKPYIFTKRTIPTEAIFDTRTISESTITKRMDMIIDEFRNYIPSAVLRKILRFIIEKLVQYSIDFSVIIANSMSTRDVIEIANSNMEFDSILHTKYSQNDNIPFIEKDISARTKRAVDIICSDKNSTIRPYLLAQGNINIGQLGQSIVCVGPRSDIQGNVIPEIVNTNFMVGLQTPIDYYIEAQSARKSLIANLFQMSRSGYSSKHLNLLSIDSWLVDVEDCGTKFHLPILVADSEVLLRLRYKNMLTGYSDNGEPEYCEICPEKHTHLIGSTIEIRSHTLCALKDGKYCKKCYGNMAYFLIGYYHSNIIATTSLSEPVGQKVLSTKHLLRTNAKSIEWSDTIKQYFTCMSNSIIYPRSIICNKMHSIGFYIDDVEEYISTISYTKTSDESNMRPENIARFILDINRGEEQIVFDDFSCDIYLNIEFASKLLRPRSVEDGIIYISLDGVKHTDPIFEVNIENNEITAYLKRIEDLLGVKKNTKYTTIEKFLTDLLVIIIELELDINFVHLESIIYNSIRDPNNLIARPDFSKSNFPEYMILPSHKSILYSPNLATSLAFERVGEQINQVITYNKNGKGFLDPFYK